MKFRSLGTGTDVSSKTRWYLFQFILLVVGISWVFASGEWISFSSQSLSPISCSDNLKEPEGTEREFTLDLSFPGALASHPDHEVLVGKNYELLSFVPPVSNLIDIHHMDALFDVEKAGMPDLPFLRFQVRIPSWVNFDVVRVEVVNTLHQALERKFNIAPVQKQIPDSDEGVWENEFLIDKKIYSSNEIFAYPIEYQKNIMHGIKFLEFFYSPLQYNPVTKEIFRTIKAQIKVSFTGQPKPENNTSPLFENVVNGSMFDAVDGEIGEKARSQPGGTFLVVVGTKMADSKVLQDYIKYRESQGYKLVEVFSSDNTSAITRKIQDTYDEKKFDYLIVVGDETVIKAPVKGTSKTGFSFKTWSTLDGSDNIEDVMMGIFLCNNETTLQNVLNHQKWQERGGPWSKTVLTTAGSVKAPTWSKYSTAHSNTVHLDDPSLGFNFTVNRVYHGARPTYYGDWQGVPKTRFEDWVLANDPFSTSSSNSTNMVKKYWNQGCAVASQRDHGNTSGPSAPKMTGSFMKGITSKSSPFFMSINCLSGCYVNNHSGNFTYQTQIREAGTCATLAASVTTATTVNCRFMTAMYGAMCPKNGKTPVLKIGEVYLIGMLKNNSSNRKHYHLFGDPMTTLSLGGATPLTNPAHDLINGKIYTVQYTGSQLVFYTPVKGAVRINLYSLRGKLIKTLVNGNLDPGSHALILTHYQPKLATGMYFANIETKDFSQTIKLVHNR